MSSTSRPSEIEPAGGRVRAVPRALGRVLPGLFPPEGAGLAGAERRIALTLLFGVLLVGTIAERVGAITLPPGWLAGGWLLALVCAAIPWQRFPRWAFASVALVCGAMIAILVSRTGGAESAYLGLFYLVALLGCVVVPPLWLGVALAAANAGLSMLPFLYQRVDEPDGLYVRAGIMISAAFFGSWLIDELARLVVVAKLDRRRLGEEQEAAAELRRAQTQRQEYMSVVAHELRNPLVAVGAAARVVAKDVQGRSSESIANGIVVEVRHALDMLDSLTDVSSMESGRLRIVLRPCDLSTLVRTTLQGVAPAHKVVLVGAETPITVLADEGRIGQVLRNLVGNAAKYAPSGSSIEVSVGLSSDRRFAVVAVRDEGPGVPPLERGRLFERFARLSTAGGTRGSGLGLYISRGIIRDHHGDLSADWPPGGGSVFTFTLPLASQRASGPGRSM